MNYIIYYIRWQREVDGHQSKVVLGVILLHRHQGRGLQRVAKMALAVVVADLLRLPSLLQESLLHQPDRQELAKQLKPITIVTVGVNLNQELRVVVDLGANLDQENHNSRKKSIVPEANLDLKNHQQEKIRDVAEANLHLDNNLRRNIHKHVLMYRIINNNLIRNLHQSKINLIIMQEVAHQHEG